MKNKPIIIVSGEPNSVFVEILLKTLKYKKFESPVILISSLKLLKYNLKKINYKKKINILNIKDVNNKKFKNNSFNLIDVELRTNHNFNKISDQSRVFIEKSFDIGLNLINNNFSNKFINGPISKKNFLDKKYPGITEYISNKLKTKKFAMLIYNKELSVCPLTTHLPIKEVTKFISRKNIFEKVNLIKNFYIKHRSINPRIAVLGLNPHCESTDAFNEDEKILKPAVKSLSKLGYKISGPHPADTIFLRNNRKKYDVVLGMYHDQVLTPIKTLYEFDAINITLGLPFLRISPDHGPNEKMLGKNLSNSLSLFRAMEFLDKN